MTTDAHQPQLLKRRRISPEFAEVLHMLSSLEKISPPAPQAPTKI